MSQPWPRDSNETASDKPGAVQTVRQPSFSAALRSIIAWLTGRQPKVSRSEQQLEQRIVDLLAEELEENEPPAQTAKPKRDAPGGT